MLLHVAVLIVVLAVAFLGVVGVMAARQRGFAHRPLAVEGEPVQLLPDTVHAQEDSGADSVLHAARRVAERRAWQVALDVARRREQEQAEQQLMQVAQLWAERRAWDVALQLAKDRARR